MAKILSFRKIKNTNQFPAVARNAPKDIDNAVRMYMLTARKIARRSMKRAPKKPKTRFGELKAYSKRSKKYGQFYWKKGQYSRPGTPPFVQGSGQGKATLKWIIVEQRGHGRWILRPGYLPGRSNIAVPDLHEFGGSVKKLNQVYFDRQGRRIKRRIPDRAQYPPRPFLAPALKTAKRWLQGRKSFIDRVNSIGRLEAVRRAA